jgi:ubiquinone/menaquinone biosynthesis C-methylase UbiE
LQGTFTKNTTSSQADLIRRVNQLYHELTAERFDAEHAARHQAECIFWQKVGKQLLADRSRKSWTVVDLACGSGFVGRTLQPYLKATDRLLAVDMSEGFLRHALDNQQTETWAMIADGQSLPLADSSVDLICINAALHHLPRPAAALREIDRVLSPGGYFALGFEPNREHFDSPLFRRLTKGLDRLRWYASPTQNRRRLRKMVGRQDRALKNHDDVLADAINNKLLSTGLIDRPLSMSDVLNLVDPHSRDEHDEQQAGFVPFALLRESMPEYVLYHLNSSDYLGLSARLLPVLRRVADVTLNRLAPRHGLLFSWLVRKPGMSIIS